MSVAAWGRRTSAVQCKSLLLQSLSPCQRLGLLQSSRLLHHASAFMCQSQLLAVTVNFLKNILMHHRLNASMALSLYRFQAQS